LTRSYSNELSQRSRFRSCAGRRNTRRCRDHSRCRHLEHVDRLRSSCAYRTSSTLRVSASNS
jgi:hypothetical protein